MSSPEEIIACARGWIGTPFHHQGRRKSVGVDCLGLLTGIAAELGLRDMKGALLSAHDRADYPFEAKHNDLQARLGELLTRKTGKPMPGDVALIRLDRIPRHVAVVSDYVNGLGLIHAYAQAGKVVEHALDSWWQKRVVGVYGLLTDSGI